jgi:hypothetical protein
MKTRTLRPVLAVALAALVAACQTAPPARDYSAFQRAAPRSILVVPPLNKSTNLDATYGFLSTATEPLAEHGYYVFPVAVVDAMFRENGLPTADEIHAVGLPKLREIFGADAVLYPVIENYGTKYVVISSTTVVNVTARLVDARSGELLWEGRAELQQGSGNGGQGLIGALVSAAMSQVLNSSRDAAHPMARLVNIQLIDRAGQGLPYGPYSTTPGKLP